MPKIKNMKLVKMKGLVTKFENAARADEFKGSCHPDDWDKIEEDYKKAKENLLKAIEELCNV